MRLRRITAAVALPWALMIAAEPQQKLSPFGSVNRLTMMPLSDYLTDRPDLAVEPGVSYLIRADNMTILMDTGLNRKGEHPSPLLRNMEALKIDPARIGMLFFSHLHGDHLGGMAQFSISRGPVALGAVPAFAPGPLDPSKFNPEPGVQVLTQPRVLASGIASIGPLPGPLGIQEQALAINLDGKGIVLFTGCGHQGVAAMAKRARQLFSEPIYGVIGGLHLQKGGPEAEQAMHALKALKLGVLAISPHDTSEEVIKRFQGEFGERYQGILVGHELNFGGSGRYD